MLQATSAGMLGAGMVSALPNLAAGRGPTAEKKSVIFIFPTGGISHQDSFDMKPYAPDSVRSEFQAIDTKTPGIQVCEHLPKLAQLSDKWSVVRSIATNSSSHGQACSMMLTGRLELPVGFKAGASTPFDWPSIPATITYAMRGQTALPPAMILPQPSVNEANSVRPGQYAGKLGEKWDAWHVDIAAQCPLGNGACPNCFRFDLPKPGEEPFSHAAESVFNTPFVKLPTGGPGRLGRRLDLLSSIESQRTDLDQINQVQKLDRSRRQAISLLADPLTSRAFDVENADPKLHVRYGKNKFGLSLLMAKQLVESGVRFVQVNLGKNSSWDTHRRNFPNLKDNLFPYLDQSLSALLSDLSESGLLENTLVVLSGEFGRTPKINKNGGRDHWGPCNTALFAGGGVRGGTVVGASDNTASYPVLDKQTPENIAATMFTTLGIPWDAQWVDTDEQTHRIYHAQPIHGLYS
jgi:hypothetical protein